MTIGIDESIGETRHDGGGNQDAELRDSETLRAAIRDELDTYSEYDRIDAETV